MIKVYNNSNPFEFQLYYKNRYVVPALYKMVDNFIEPFVTDGFIEYGTPTISTQKLYKYVEASLSRTPERTEIKDLTLTFSLQTLGDYKKWYTSGEYIDNLGNGLYAIEFIDSDSRTFTTSIFRVCQDVAGTINYFTIDSTLYTIDSTLFTIDKTII